MAGVGCAGILVADTFCGPLPELPAAGGIVALDTMPTKVGGCAANVAIGLAKQAFQVELAGCVGADPHAETVFNALAQYGIDCRHVVTTEAYPTSQTVILLIEGEDRRYLHVVGANAAFDGSRLGRDWLAGLSVLYLGGLGALPGLAFGELADALRFCRRHAVTTVVDVVLAQACPDAAALRALLPLIDYLLPNADEARLLTGETAPQRQLATLLRSGAQTVILTRGEQGAIAARGSTTWSCGTFPVTAVDPSGSGDAFAAGVVAAILNGWEMPELLRYAAALGASANRAIGATDGVFTAAEAVRFLEDHHLEVTGHGH